VLWLLDNEKFGWTKYVAAQRILYNHFITGSNNSLHETLLCTAEVHMYESEVLEKLPNLIWNILLPRSIHVESIAPRCVRLEQILEQILAAAAGRTWWEVAILHRRTQFNQEFGIKRYLSPQEGKKKHIEQ
jgi:hypothetical protein